MRFDRHFATLLQTFSDQFVATDAGYIYRKSGKGDAISVTAAERDRYVEAFDRVLRCSTWGIVAATIMLILVLVLLLPDRHGEENQLPIMVGIGCIVAVFGGLYHRAWERPARDLARRAIIAQALSRDEARRIALSKISYGQLGMSAIIGVTIACSHATSGGWHGWSILWLVFAGVTIVMATVQALRKWRIDRRSS